MAKGYSQVKGLDFDETYAPIARFEAIRILLAFATHHDFKLYQMDVKSAFLNGPIKEEVYVEQPPRFEDPKYPNHVFKLHKVLYGLKQAPRAWYECLRDFLVKKGSVIGKADVTLFTKRFGNDIFVCQIYVDDIIFGSTNQNFCDEFSKIMTKRFDMSMMGELTYFLGFQVKQLKEGTFTCQAKYTQDLLKKFDMDKAKPIKTPMPTNGHIDLNKKDKLVDQKMAHGKRQKHPGTPSDSDADFDPNDSPVARRGGGGKRGRGGASGPSTTHGVGLGRGKGKGKAIPPRDPTPSEDEEEDSDEEEEEDDQQEEEEGSDDAGDEFGDEVVHEPIHGPMHSSVTYQLLAPQVDDQFQILVAPSRDKMRVYRHRNPWTEPKHPGVTDVRFWDLTQVAWYKNILKKTTHRVAPMKCIDWDRMAAADDPTFQLIRSECDRKNMTAIMGLHQHWNDEIIAQFYATMWIELDKENHMDSNLHWTIEGNRFTITYFNFSQIIGFDDTERAKPKATVFDPQEDSEWEFMYDACYADPNHGVEFGSYPGVKPYFRFICDHKHPSVTLKKFPLIASPPHGSTPPAVADVPQSSAAATAGGEAAGPSAAPRPRRQSSQLTRAIKSMFCICRDSAVAIREQQQALTQVQSDLRTLAATSSVELPPPVQFTPLPDMSSYDDPWGIYTQATQVVQEAQDEDVDDGDDDFMEE
ncbi:hypothetical protein QOZ80_9BG0710570 [Eleusine coracana subsp. coracana]|nr:hypothetical protein QOZ80_9BG0710570 [Eleusine coracana subsp. coracana]